VVPLPMSIGRFSGAGELAKVIAIHLGGWLASIFSTVAIVRTLLRRGGEKRSKEESPPTRRSSPQVEAAAADAEAIEAEQGKRAAALAVAAQAKAHRLAVRQAWTSFAPVAWHRPSPALHNHGVTASRRASPRHTAAGWPAPTRGFSLRHDGSHIHSR
jgi:hypothetical protein